MLEAVSAQRVDHFNVSLHDTWSRADSLRPKALREFFHRPPAI
jgi:hypothetical protein